MDLKGYHHQWGNPITKEHTSYALTDKWILAQKLRIPKIQFAKHMKLKKKEDQSVDTLILLRRGKNNHRKSYRDKVWSRDWRNVHPETATPGDPPHKQPPNPDTLADANKSLLTGAWYSCLLRGSACACKCRSGCSQLSIVLSTGSPMNDLEIVPKEMNVCAAP